MKRQPLLKSGEPSFFFGSLPSLNWGGFSVPWYQVSLTAGSAYTYSARNEAGASSAWGGGPKASIVFGCLSPRAQKGRSFQWLPRSLIVPLAKSHQRYHFGPGW